MIKLYDYIFTELYNKAEELYDMYAHVVWNSFMDLILDYNMDVYSWYDDLDID